jgi:peptide/nickel transport system permease protein
MLELEQAHVPGRVGESAGTVRGTRRLLRALLARPLTLVGALLVLGFLVMGGIGPAVAPRDPATIYYTAVQIPPSRAFPFGTDDNGRDILSRVLAGARISLTIGIVATVIASTGGTLLGILAGYRGGLIDGVIMRLMDVMLAFPDILLAMVVITILGPNLGSVTIAVGIAAIPAYTRTLRAAVLVVREQDYIEAARALGASPWRIMRVHVLRNILSPLLVLMTISVGLFILTAAGLSFVGLGAQPPTPEWGAMLNEAQDYMQQAWWMAVFPGVALVLTVTGLNLLGEGLREILDPRLR